MTNLWPATGPVSPFQRFITEVPSAPPALLFEQLIFTRQVPAHQHVHENVFTLERKKKKWGQTSGKKLG